MFSIFKKKEEMEVKPEPVNEDEFGGLGETLFNKVLGAFGITEEQINKVKAIIDMVEVNQHSDHTELIIRVKSVTIKIDK